MRIVCISDTHSVHESLQLPDGDILIHAGDLTRRGSAGEIESFNRWLGTLPHKHKILVAGNHDLLFEADVRLASQLITNGLYLCDSGVTIEGVRFFGSPWQPTFDNTAFNIDRGPKIKQKWDLIPEHTNVLITHGPPFGILDAALRSTPQGYENTGCEELLAAVKQIRPILHVFGHIHEAYGIKVAGATTFVNACICDSSFRPTNSPVVFNLLR